MLAATAERSAGNPELIAEWRPGHMVAQQVLDGHDGQDSTPIGDGPHAEGPSNRPDPAARPFRHRSPANQYRHDNQPLPARIADRVTAVFGSWAFILTRTFLIILWIGRNAFVAVRFLHSSDFYPYPFILLNLLFSTQAAYAAPLILLSQNRTAGTRPHQGRTRFRCQRPRVA